MTSPVRKPDGLIGYPISTPRGPQRRYWCEVCEGRLNNKQRTKIGPHDAMMSWWAKHRQTISHQSKMGAVSDEVFVAAAQVTELAQRNKALARIRRTA